MKVALTEQMLAALAHDNDDRIQDGDQVKKKKTTKIKLFISGG